MNKLRLLLAAAFIGAVLPAGAATAAPECDDPVAHAIHDVEGATGLEPLHEVEEAYCGLT
jgi:hypothetical protein